jgi:urease accessory protein
MDALNSDVLSGDRTFAANRATGDIALAVSAAGGTSRRTRVHEAGSLRVRFPNTHDAGALDAVIVNTAGGMTGGDRFAVRIDVEASARLTVTTAAAEKIYRSLGPDTEIGVRLAVKGGAALAWLPQETILFDRARLHRTIDIDLASGASLLAAEAIVFGRAAMGETVADGSLFDRWRVRVEGALVFAETIRLDGAIAQRLAETAIAKEGAAVDTVAAVRAMQPSFAGEVGVSTWNGLAVARLVARDCSALRHDLACVLTACSNAPLPRLWLN